MRKVLFYLCLCLSFTAKAQLKVATGGNVSIGTTSTPLSKLSVGFSGMSTYLASFKTTDTNSGIYLRNTGPVGLSIRNETINNSYSMTGIEVDPLTLTASYAPRYGITSYGAPSSIVSVGVAGGVRYNGNSSNAICTGIYGTSGNINAYNALYKGVYAGYFDGDARVTGSLYATVLTPSGTSSGSSVLAESVPQDNGDECVTEKLSRVGMVALNRDVETRILRDRAATGSMDAQYGHKDDVSVLTSFDSEDLPAQTSLSAVRFGLAADQLKAVYPELVYEDEAGNVSINYIEMIPLLVQSINELNARVIELEGEGDASASRKAVQSKSDARPDMPNVMELSMSQNYPNPFSQTTSIELNIPVEISSACIFIYDMSGKQIRKLQIAERGRFSVSLTADELNAGMYLYTLIADGKVIDTRKMILTK